MWFMDVIIAALSSILQWLYDAAYYCWDSWYVPNGVGDAFWWIRSNLIDIGFKLVAFNEWLDNATAWIARILSYDNIYSHFKGYFNAAQDAWAWVWDAVSNVWSIVDDWWSGVWADVQSWVNSAIDIAGDVIDSIYGWVNDIKDTIYDLIDKIPSINEIISWFGRRWDEMFAQLRDWGFLPKEDISDLINTRLKDWSISDAVGDMIYNFLRWAAWPFLRALEGFFNRILDERED